MSQRHNCPIAVSLALALLIPQFSQDAIAQTLTARAGAKTSIHTAATRPAPRPTLPQTGHRPAPPRPGGGVNINHNNNINVNVQGAHHDGHGYPPPPPYHGDHHHDHHDDWDDWDHHPFAVAAAVTAGAALTSAVIGSIVRTIPPQCVPVNVNGITYQQCGSTWYQPQYVGTAVQYVVVVPPR